MNNSIFEKIKYYYIMGYYKLEHLYKLLKVQAITQEEFELIIQEEVVLKN